jgi:tRNA(fMet)-specific endonuclease VapC
LIKQKSSIILEKLKNAQPLGVGISSITLSELEYGVQKSTFIDRNALNLLQFLTLFTIVPFDASAARIYGKIRATLERKGQLIGGMDMLIGAHSLSMNTILVTNNMQEFNRIDGLQLENWTKE